MISVLSTIQGTCSSYLTKFKVNRKRSSNAVVHRRETERVELSEKSRENKSVKLLEERNKHRKRERELLIITISINM